VESEGAKGIISAPDSDLDLKLERKGRPFLSVHMRSSQVARFSEAENAWVQMLLVVADGWKTWVLWSALTVIVVAFASLE
jgi:hypothetical protein